MKKQEQPSIKTGLMIIILTIAVFASALSYNTEDKITGSIVKITGMQTGGSDLITQYNHLMGTGKILTTFRQKEDGTWEYYQKGMTGYEDLSSDGNDMAKKDIRIMYEWQPETTWETKRGQTSQTAEEYTYTRTQIPGVIQSVDDPDEYYTSDGLRLSIDSTGNINGYLDKNGIYTTSASKADRSWNVEYMRKDRGEGKLSAYPTFFFTEGKPSAYDINTKPSWSVDATEIVQLSDQSGAPTNDQQDDSNLYSDNNYDLIQNNGLSYKHLGFSTVDAAPKTLSSAGETFHLDTNEDSQHYGHYFRWNPNYPEGVKPQYLIPPPSNEYRSGNDVYTITLNGEEDNPRSKGYSYSAALSTVAEGGTGQLGVDERVDERVDEPETNLETYQKSFVLAFSILTKDIEKFDDISQTLKDILALYGINTAKIYEQMKDEAKKPATQRRISSEVTYDSIEKMIQGLSDAAKNEIRAKFAENEDTHSAVRAELYTKLGYHYIAGVKWIEADKPENAALSFRRYLKNPPFKDGKIDVDEYDARKKKVEDIIIPIIEATDDDKLKAALEKELKIINNIVYINSKYPGWFGDSAKFLDMLFNNWFTDLFLNRGYPKIAGLLYNYDDPWMFELGDKWNNYLSGPQGVAAELCKKPVAVDDLEGGFATSHKVGGPYATIEGEKITIINYTDPTPTTFYYYKISIDIYPGTSALGCDLKFQIYLEDKNGNKVHLMLENESGLPYTWDIKRGDPAVSFKGPDMYVRPSKKEYKKACIKFHRIIPREERSCLIGIEEGDQLCSIIKEGETHEFDFKCDYCDSSGAKFWTLGFSGWEGKGEPSGSVTPSSEEKQPKINDNI